MAGFFVAWAFPPPPGGPSILGGSICTRAFAKVQKEHKVNVFVATKEMKRTEAVLLAYSLARGRDGDGTRASFPLETSGGRGWS
uniref:Uncharacterized protein n=1 Tax=Oryza glumipatula TaxID=40148 RepID=A0A0E0AUF9_9ORYZ